jgi:hypothetical protein
VFSFIYFYLSKHQNAHHHNNTRGANVHVDTVAGFNGKEMDGIGEHHLK